MPQQDAFQRLPHLFGRLVARSSGAFDIARIRTCTTDSGISGTMSRGSGLVRCSA